MSTADASGFAFCLFVKPIDPAGADEAHPGEKRRRRVRSTGNATTMQDEARRGDPGLIRHRRSAAGAVGVTVGL